MTSIVYPKCGGPTRVTETRGAPSGMRRRRACARDESVKHPVCGGRVTTLEIVVHQADRLIDGMVMVPRERLRRMAALLADVLQEQVGAP